MRTRPRCATGTNASPPARYPCGLMQGDDKAKATVDAMMSGLLKDVSKYSLEKGVATSVLANRKDLVRQVWCGVVWCGMCVAGWDGVMQHAGIRVSPLGVLLCCPRFLGPFRKNAQNCLYYGRKLPLRTRCTFS